MNRSTLLALAILIFMVNPRAGFTAESAEDRFKIDVATAGAGSDLFERWGHISIIVTDQFLATRKAYDFGTYRFDDPAILFRYARGHLDFYLSTTTYETIVRRYVSQKRDVVFRTLNLTPEQAETLAKSLEVNALPENRTYAYRHCIDNCCTRVRDHIDAVLGGSIREEFDTVPTGRSYRYFISRGLKGKPVMRNIILFILGREIDKPITRWDEQFLPEIFGEDLDRITVSQDKGPLVAHKLILYRQSGPRLGEKKSLWEYGVSALILLLLFSAFGACALLRKKHSRRARQAAGVGLFLWGLIGGLGGLLVVVLWFWTAHYDGHNNENVLVFPITHLWLLGPGLALITKGTLHPKVNRALQVYFLACLAILGIMLLLKLGPLFQENYQFIAFAAVLDTASFLSLRTPAGNSQTA